MALPPAEADAIRLLEQATWGPNDALIDAVNNIGVERFIDKQLATPADASTRSSSLGPRLGRRPASTTGRCP